MMCPDDMSADGVRQRGGEYEARKSFYTSRIIFLSN